MSTPEASSSAPPDYSEEKQAPPPSVNQVAPQFTSGQQQQPFIQYGQAPMIQYGQVPMHGQAPMAIQQPNVQYMVAAPPPKPNYHGPHTFIVTTILVAVLGGLVNITSLAFGIPAIVCTIMSAHKKSNGQYSAASKLSSAALGLTITNIIYTLLIWTMIVGLVTDYDYSYYSDFKSQCRYLRYNFQRGYYCSGYRY